MATVREERRRRSRAAELPDRDAELLGLVGKVVVDARSREMHHALWHDLQHLVVALERRRATVLRPVGREADLRHVAVLGPQRRNLVDRKSVVSGKSVSVSVDLGGRRTIKKKKRRHIDYKPTIK